MSGIGYHHNVVDNAMITHEMNDDGDTKIESIRDDNTNNNNTSNDSSSSVSDLPHPPELLLAVAVSPHFDGVISDPVVRTHDSTASSSHLPSVARLSSAFDELTHGKANESTDELDTKEMIAVAQSIHNISNLTNDEAPTSALPPSSPTSSVLSPSCNTPSLGARLSPLGSIQVWGIAPASISGRPIVRMVLVYDMEAPFPPSSPSNSRFNLNNSESGMSRVNLRDGDGVDTNRRSISESGQCSPLGEAIAVKWVCAPNVFNCECSYTAQALSSTPMTDNNDDSTAIGRHTLCDDLRVGTSGILAIAFSSNTILLVSIPHPHTFLHSNYSFSGTSFPVLPLSSLPFIRLTLPLGVVIQSLDTDQFSNSTSTSPSSSHTSSSATTSTSTTPTSTSSQCSCEVLSSGCTVLVGSAQGHLIGWQLSHHCLLLLTKITPSHPVNHAGAQSNECIVTVPPSFLFFPDLADPDWSSAPVSQVCLGPYLPSNTHPSGYTRLFAASFGFGSVLVFDLALPDRPIAHITSLFTSFAALTWLPSTSVLTVAYDDRLYLVSLDVQGFAVTQHTTTSSTIAPVKIRLPSSPPSTSSSDPSITASSSGGGSHRFVRLGYPNIPPHAEVVSVQALQSNDVLTLVTAFSTGEVKRLLIPPSLISTQRQPFIWDRLGTVQALNHTELFTAGLPSLNNTLPILTLLPSNALSAPLTIRRPKTSRDIRISQAPNNFDIHSSNTAVPPPSAPTWVSYVHAFGKDWVLSGSLAGLLVVGEESSRQKGSN